MLTKSRLLKVKAGDLYRLWVDEHHDVISFQLEDEWTGINYQGDLRGKKGALDRLWDYSHSNAAAFQFKKVQVQYFERK